MGWEFEWRGWKAYHNLKKALTLARARRRKIRWKRYDIRIPSDLWYAVGEISEHTGASKQGLLCEAAIIGLMYLAREVEKDLKLPEPLYISKIDMEAVKDAIQGVEGKDRRRKARYWVELLARDADKIGDQVIE